MRWAPPAIRVVAGVVVIRAVWSGVNWGYRVIRKPTELFFPVSAALGKTPPETWRKYEPLFREHATAVITPELLAALAQVEGAGNPVARTYWRWRLTWKPFELYRPKGDRKSTRLNSSHGYISYAVFCLKKKNN